MKIKIVITANETGYAYNQPEGKAEIEIDISEGAAESVEIGATVQAAVIGAVHEYKDKMLDSVMAKSIEDNIEK
jgi:hypothetical protein